jgi:2-dehydro-3-deoxyphosphogluconate aldolase/(4S)-4-hydroxy-2-oxoglutarate aldolase
MTAILTRADVVRRIEEAGVVAVVRLTEAASGPEVARALLEGGVSAIEITMTVPRAVDLIAGLCRALPQALIGAGTVTDPAVARAVIDAGAKFVVSPVVRPRMIEACHERQVPAFPGCFSPTEILAAWELGAELVKIFPATSLGPGFIKDLRGPFPSIKVMPTGGVSRENAADWIRAGAAAIGVGTAMVDGKAIAARQFDVITANARAFVDAVREARETPGPRSPFAKATGDR